MDLDLNLKLDFIDKNLPKYVEWRHHLHSHPELSCQEQKTSEFIAARLDEFGLSYERLGLGLVAKLEANGTKKKDIAIGLRADFDALPIHEANSFAHKSINEGVMHACGHDGHTAMLLGAAQYAAAHQDELTCDSYFIFQPAEEVGGGASEMIKNGLFRDNKIDEIYGMHNWPGLAVGEFAVRPGPMMAAVDFFDIHLSGGGGHAAMPHHAKDTLLVAAQIITQFQSIVSRNTHPCDALVISCTGLNAEATYNVLPAEVSIKGTVRYFTPKVKEDALKKMQAIIKQQCELAGLKGKMTSNIVTAATFNHPGATETAIKRAQNISKVHTDIHPSMGGEDFAYMLEEKTGSYIRLGNGDTAGLHSPDYDFNDKAMKAGICYWLALISS